MLYILKKKRVYSLELKVKAVHLREQGLSYSAIANELDITNRSQVKQWWDWYKAGELNRLSQPIGKQYSYGHGPEGKTPEETLSIKNVILENHVMLLKKYLKKDKEWYQKYL